MRVVIQRVTKASVIVNGRVKSEISKGLLILAGIETSDNKEDVVWLSNKIVNLRIFNDTNDVMNLSVLESGGDILVVSQFTLHAKTKKGNRPSYIRAANPGIAIPVYNSFVSQLELLLGKKIKTGEFGAMMLVESVNDGPVTILIDTKEKE
ncbi:MAG TPA: D-aminoacyl-tRNA deacylase [Bacteroidales bacterium]|nr:D-aminoacyl-tRNA deacylase [Bacteroidales bacterium]